jgi:hypothetical protein
MAAKAIGQDTPLPSLELSWEGGERSGPFINTISWQTATSPLPWKAIRRSFSKSSSGMGKRSGAKARRQQSRSLLDSVIDQVASMKNQLPGGDRGRLTAYLDDVREIERRIEKSEKQMAAAKLDVPDTPTGAPENLDDHLKMLFDLQVLAFGLKSHVLPR